MNRSGRREWGVIILTLLLLPWGLTAAEETVGPILHDRDLFPEELFPGVEELDESELLLEALQHHFPGRVLNTPPLNTLDSQGEPTGRESDAGVSYIRVRNLSAALPWIERGLGDSVVLIDLRYVKSDLVDAIALATLLAGEEKLVFDLLGQYATTAGMKESNRLIVATDEPSSGNPTVIVLTNRETSGPLEAILSELQAHRSIMIIGTRTAGLTAAFRRVPGNPGWYVISGEIQPASEGSLVGSGLSPDIQVEVDADDESAAYAGFDPNLPLNTILEQAVEKERFDEAHLLAEFSRIGSVQPLPQPTEPVDEEAAETGAETHSRPIDQALRRSFYVIEAMRALGRIIEGPVED